MGAKTPEQLNLRRPTVSCDICGRKFLNIRALTSHQAFLHTKTDGSKRLLLKKQLEAKPLNKKVPELLKNADTPVKSKQATKPVVKEKKDTNVAGKQDSLTKKAQFECPVCAKIFPVYFTAFRHIQKTHCIDDSGEKVQPNSPNLVKPIRIEICASCNKEIRSTVQHSCPKQQAIKDQYRCMGCEQIFSGLVLFQHHVKGLHAEDAQHYFFPCRKDFTSWKYDLEKQVNVSFIRLNKQKGKELFHCSHQPNTTLAKPQPQLCPATIIIREFSKGLHVSYFQEHHGHNPDTSPLAKYNQYSVSLYLRETEELKLEAEDDNDLYLQFKKMVTCVVCDAAKVDVNTLKELLGKTLEMTSILNQYESEGHDTPLISKSLTDAQISRSLESFKSEPSKRKLSPLPKETKKDAKKSKKESPVPSSLPAVKLVENGDNKTPEKHIPALPRPVKSSIKSLPKKEEVEKKKADTPRPFTPMQRSQLQSPTSFNDQYKNFVDQNFKCLPDTSTQTSTQTSTPKIKTPVKKKEVVKTKIGQFRVKSGTPSPKENIPKEKDTTPIVSSPKVPSKPLAETSAAWKVKPDIKYEVKEQENDCNILILKI